MKYAKSLVGNSFGRLTILDRVPNTGKSLDRVTWRCLCICGTIKNVQGGNLKNGTARSCGCFALEGKRQRPLTHGLSRSVEHRTWSRIKDRCFNERTKCYARYGALGTRVCSGWKVSFQNFFLDMGYRPADMDSIDRIESSGHYSCGHCEECLEKGWPANCRWATDEVQANNQKSNVKITRDGVTKTIAEWAKHLGIKYATLYMRLKSRGWDQDRAFTASLKKWPKNDAPAFSVEEIVQN